MVQPIPERSERVAGIFIPVRVVFIKERLNAPFDPVEWFSENRYICQRNENNCIRMVGLWMEIFCCLKISNYTNNMFNVENQNKHKEK